MIDTPQLERLAHAITNIVSAKAYIGHCFRFVKPKYGNRLDAFSGEGSRKTSGRFHVKGKFLLVYTSTDLQTAEWEYFHTARSIGFDPAYLLPCTAISASVRLSKVLNLGDAQVRRSLKVTLAELRSFNWEDTSEEMLTQAIGQFAYEAGFEAVLVPSMCGGRNLNKFRQNLIADSFVEIINEHELLGQ